MKAAVAMIFATSQFRSEDYVDGEYVTQPASLVHAKAMGGTPTLCGLSAHSWYKFLTLPYHQVTSGRCGDCDEVLRSERSTRP